MTKLKTTGVQRFTLVLSDKAAEEAEVAIFALRSWRKVSFGSFVEAALQDLLDKSPEERKAVLDRHGATSRRPRTRRPVGLVS